MIFIEWTNFAARIVCQPNLYCCGKLFEKLTPNNFRQFIFINVSIYDIRQDMCWRELCVCVYIYRIQSILFNDNNGFPCIRFANECHTLSSNFCFFPHQTPTLTATAATTSFIVDRHRGNIGYCVCMSVYLLNICPLESYRSWIESFVLWTHICDVCQCMCVWFRHIEQKRCHHMRRIAFQRNTKSFVHHAYVSAQAYMCAVCDTVADAGN